MTDIPPTRHHTNRPGPIRRSGSADDAVGQILGDRYRLLAPLGSGASAWVYLAEDVLLGRRVAVKCLRPGLKEEERFLRRFRAEAKAAAALSHPNLLAVYDWGEAPTPYLVTEVLLGGSLLEILNRSTGLSPSQGLLVGLQVAQGLNYAHELGIVHRDIKPANLLFGEEGRLRIADFGIARAMAEAAWVEPEGVLVGTARYAAPEQALGQVVSGAADVYSLALTIIEAVTGKVPLLQEHALATMVLRQDVDLGPQPELGALGDALQLAGRADPASRPTAAELIESLTRAARALPRPRRLSLVVSYRQHDLTSGAADEAEADVDTSESEIEMDEVDLRSDDEVDLRHDDGDDADDGGEGGPDEPRLQPGEWVKSRPIPKPNPLYGTVLQRPPIAPWLGGLPSPAAGGGTSPRSGIGSNPRAAAPEHRASEYRAPEHRAPEPEASEPGAPEHGVSEPGAPEHDAPDAKTPEPSAPISERALDVEAFLSEPSVPVQPKSKTSPASTERHSDDIPLARKHEPTAPAPIKLKRVADLRHPVPSPPTPEVPEVGKAPGLVAPTWAQPNREPEAARTPPLSSVLSAFSEPGATQPPPPTASAVEASASVLPLPTVKVEWLRPRLPLVVALIVGSVVAAIITILVVPALRSSTPPPTTLAPRTLPLVGDYVGSTVGEVEAEADTNNWELVIVEEYRATTEAGEIASQDPTTGALAPGAELTIVVSLGPEFSPVPPLVGLTTEEAAAALTEAGLAVGNLIKEFNDEIASGVVVAIYTDGEEPGTEVAAGTAIDLVISTGGGSAEALPSFVGLSLEVALAQADELGLVVTEEEAYNEIYDEGFVFDHTPPTDAPFTPGDELTLVLSRGSAFATIPNMTGIDPAEAADRLVEAGFTVIDTIGPPNQPVLSTSPAAGESRSKGTGVVIRTSKS
ncbi:MAG: PASTA domain-containing protein [Actinomycetia bacterium]|nr:PASTA domain-containing protein [Actinomycetes bacterium]